MTYTLSSFTALGLLALTASGYAIATIGMKLASGGISTLSLFVIAGGLLLAVAMEIILLRIGNMSLVYLGIVVAETVLVLAYAHSVGHGLNLIQMFGAGLVLIGVVLLGAHA
jgi:hypothetical protein